MEFKELTACLEGYTLPLIEALHNVALKIGCKYGFYEKDGQKTIAYSARNFKIHIRGNKVSFEGDYDIRAFVKLFWESKNQTVKELLFKEAPACSYCSDDKCTTFLMAKQRTLELDGESKKLCSLYGHHLVMEVTVNNLPACVTIAEMMFKYTYDYPNKHNEIFPVNNEVKYILTQKDEFYLVGYQLKHSQISPSEEEFISSVLQKGEDGKSKIDTVLNSIQQKENAEYAGAYDNFINGVLYDFIFGVITHKKPSTLPNGVVCRKIRGGEWAVYNSSAGDYKSIWKHYTESFYNHEKKGFDTTRIPFEYYDADGKFFDVHIPVDSDIPADSGRVVTLHHLPDTSMAGFGNFSESDYPLYCDRPFLEHEKVKELFPLTDKVVRVSIHSLFGKPLQSFDGVFIDDYTVIPDGVELYTLKGGYWKIAGCRHFNGGHEYWPFDVSLDSKLPLNDYQHPRSYSVYIYNSRGGYVETCIPMRVFGNFKYDIVELPSQRVIGKLEAPPESIVTDEDIKNFCTLNVNSEGGSYVIGYTTIRLEAGWVYYDKPLIKGVLAKSDVPVPQGFLEFEIESGRYVKVTEDVPNGVLGWESWVFLNCIENEMGLKIDKTRRFIVKQLDFGKRFEFYVPIH